LIRLSRVVVPMLHQNLIKSGVGLLAQ